MNTATKVKNIVEQGYSRADYSFTLELLAGVVDQDWDNETTIYTFDDGSFIRDTNGQLDIGSK